MLHASLWPKPRPLLLSLRPSAVLSFAPRLDVVGGMHRPLQSCVPIRSRAMASAWHGSLADRTRGDAAAALLFTRHCDHDAFLDNCRTSHVRTLPNPARPRPRPSSPPPRSLRPSMACVRCPALQAPRTTIAALTARVFMKMRTKATTTTLHHGYIAPCPCLPPPPQCDGHHPTTRKTTTTTRRDPPRCRFR